MPPAIAYYFMLWFYINYLKITQQNNYWTESDYKMHKTLYNLNTFVSTRKVSRSTEDACLL